MSSQESFFGVTQHGLPVTRYVLSAGGKVTVALLDFGAVIHTVYTPDKFGTLADVVLGYDDVAGYEQSNTYFGAVIGRFGNRLKHGKFTLNGQSFQLATNNGSNHLHGGEIGFDKRLWQAHWIDKACIEFSLVSADGDQGYPGRLHVAVRYRLSSDGELSVKYQAHCDADTIVNLTQHSYFNLSGDPEQAITDHRLQIDANQITEVDDTLIPTGRLLEVNNTPFDLRKAQLLRDVIDQPHRQLQYGGGFDHNYVLNNPDIGTRRVATVRHPHSGRQLSVATDLPGMQFYSGNFLNGSEHGKSGVRYPFRGGLCLETQGFPDAPNHPNFPSVLLPKGKQYVTETRFSFSNTDI